MKLKKDNPPCLRYSIFMKAPYNILDFETTGLSPNTERVIEIGAVKVENGQVTKTFQTLINPGRPIPPFITQITGINTRMVQMAPRAPEAFFKLIEFLSHDPIIAHNASFDSRFFQAETARLGLQATNPFLCTLMLARRLYPELHNHKLETLCGHFSISRENAHRALADVLMTDKVFKKICEKIKIHLNNEALEFSTLVELSNVSQKMLSHFLEKNRKNG